MDDVIIIDDFYKKPDIVRKFALNLDYENNSTPNYPGFQSTIPCLSSSVIHKFEAAVKCKINLATSRKLMGYFRCITASGKSRLKVHTDMTDWTVVIYLTPDSPKTKTAGTNLYQHKKTGLNGPPTQQDMLSLGYKNLTDFENKVVIPDTLNELAWKVVYTIPYQFNRCVIFKANKNFHSHANGFGQSITDGRLTQNFFFNTEDTYV